MSRGSLDGAVFSQSGRDWIVHEEQDDDGRWYGWSECGECGDTVRMGDDARQDHECPPACPECGQRDEDARTEPASDGYPIWQCCGQEARCPCGAVTSTNHRFVCTAWITP